MEQLDYIPINIWDDFYEDEYVPKGKIQETYIYVEESDISHEKRKAILEILLTELNALDLIGVEIELYYYDSRLKYPSFIGAENECMMFERWEIRVKYLTHKRLDVLLNDLELANLHYDNIPFHIYSKS